MKKDRVNDEKPAPAEDCQESGYYYDDSSGYEVYEHDAEDADDESTTENKPTPDS